MGAKPKVVFKMQDVPFLESPDGAARDSFLVNEETCGAQQYTAGLYFVRPGSQNRADRHPGQEELYYIFAGRGSVVVDGEAHEIAAGDVVFIPDGATHYVKSDPTESLGLFWAIATKWSNLTDIQREIKKWHVIEPGSPWGSPAQS